MNDEQAPAEQLPQKEDGIGDDRLALKPHTDWFLASLTSLANKGLTFPVTLFVGGAAISGILVGGKTYFDEFSRMMRRSFRDNEESADIMASFVDQCGSFYGDAAEIAARPPEYVHLVEARLFHPGADPVPKADGVLWRGKLASVDGFCWGTLVWERR
ncbi:MAG: hypothetical protein ACK4K7_06775 [Allosphingosinicella sp.]|uniref:hypothetical protein n=1 Tax=Allosphingosinicella sp. TaxID=2823234 RepID=UPI0039313794